MGETQSHLTVLQFRLETTHSHASWKEAWKRFPILEVETRVNLQEWEISYFRTISFMVFTKSPAWILYR